MKIKCPACNAENEVSPKHIGQYFRCVSCKTEFKIENPNLHPCPDCFAPISKRAAVCPHCGAVFASASIADQNIEDPVDIFHPSGRYYFWEIVFGIITVPILIGVVILLWVLIKVKTSAYELTTRRIIVSRGLFSKVRNEIWIKDMRGVNLVQSFWQRILGIGNIAIGTAATAETEIYLIGIANPNEVIGKINSLRKK